MKDAVYYDPSEDVEDPEVVIALLEEQLQSEKEN